MANYRLSAGGGGALWDRHFLSCVCHLHNVLGHTVWTALSTSRYAVGNNLALASLSWLDNIIFHILSFEVYICLFERPRNQIENCIERRSFKCFEQHLQLVGTNRLKRETWTVGDFSFCLLWVFVSFGWLFCGVCGFFGLFGQEGFWFFFLPDGNDCTLLFVCMYVCSLYTLKYDFLLKLYYKPFTL